MSLSITVDLSELSIEQLIENELETIIQTDITFDPWPGRTPLDIEWIENRKFQDPEDTTEHLINNLPISSVRLG